jgi:hypothetical protein
MAKNAPKKPRSHADSLLNRIALVVRQSICEQALERHAHGTKLFFADSIDESTIRSHYNTCVQARKFQPAHDGGFRFRATVKRITSWYTRLMKLDLKAQVAKLRKDLGRSVEVGFKPTQSWSESPNVVISGGTGGHAPRYQRKPRGPWYVDRELPEERAAA